jgi:hypothetical protein
MKTVKNESELVDIIDFQSYLYKGKKYDSYKDLKSASIEYFSSITAGFEDEEDYYDKFGLKIGECHLDTVKSEKYFNKGSNATITVDFVEGYIDSGAPEEDYFYGYFFTES